MDQQIIKRKIMESIIDQDIDTGADKASRWIAVMHLRALVAAYILASMLWFMGITVWELFLR